MLNHIRNLLMNIDGTSLPYPVLGEELIPAAYRRIVLPGAIVAARQVIFGSSPDRYMLNYRVRQLLGVIHATELQEFIYATDPRISYEPYEDIYSAAALFRPVADKLGDTTNELPLSGDEPAPDSSGVMYREWHVEIIDGDTLQLTPVVPMGEPDEVTYMLTNGLSESLSLPGSTLRYRTYGGTGNKWRIRSLVRPQDDLGTILATLEQLGEEAMVVMFQQDNAVGQSEPYKTFHSLWRERRELAYRLGAFALAMAYTTELHG